MTTHVLVLFYPLPVHAMYSPDAQALFADASNAYTVLSNEEKRQVYDREGEEVRRQRPRPPP